MKSKRQIPSAIVTTESTEFTEKKFPPGTSVFSVNSVVQKSFDRFELNLTGNNSDFQLPLIARNPNDWFWQPG